jgi:hypothetical protein
MKLFALFALIVFFLWVGWSSGYENGLKDGCRNALKINPPSESLELACAALWVGEQSKKWQDKTNK